MRVTRPTYTEEFRQDAVALMRGTDRSFKQVAADLGVSEWSLRQWYNCSEVPKKSRKQRKAETAAQLGNESAEQKADASRAGESNAPQGKRLAAYGSRNPKKSSGLLREGKRMKFAFIDKEKAFFPIAPMCRLLGVTRQGYYSYAKRPPPERRPAEVALRAEVSRIHEKSRGTYGSPRVLAELRASGFPASKRRVERTMRGMGLQARPRGRFRTTTKADPKHPVAPNLLNRQS